MSWASSLLDDMPEAIEDDATARDAGKLMLTLTSWR
jgi:hypothetical protein